MISEIRSRLPGYPQYEEARRAETTRLVVVTLVVAIGLVAVVIALHW